MKKRSKLTAPKLMRVLAIIQAAGKRGITLDELNVNRDTLYELRWYDMIVSRKEYVDGRVISRHWSKRHASAP